MLHVSLKRTQAPVMLDEHCPLGEGALIALALQVDPPKHACSPCSVLTRCKIGGGGTACVPSPVCALAHLERLKVAARPLELDALIVPDPHLRAARRRLEVAPAAPHRPLHPEAPRRHVAATRRLPVRLVAEDTAEIDASVECGRKTRDQAAVFAGRRPKVVVQERLCANTSRGQGRWGVGTRGRDLLVSETTIRRAALRAMLPRSRR